jgi:type II secretory pathway component PulJ
MTLAELLTASAVFAIGASAALQLSASASRSTLAAEQHRHRASNLEARVLAVEAELQQLVGTPLAADCASAAAWLIERSPSLQAKRGGLLLQLEGDGGLRRERWYDPVALGLCLPEASDGVL